MQYIRFLNLHDILVFTVNVLPHLNVNVSPVFKYGQVPQRGSIQLETGGVSSGEVNLGLVRSFFHGNNKEIPLVVTHNLL